MGSGSQQGGGYGGSQMGGGYGMPGGGIAGLTGGMSPGMGGGMFGQQGGPMGGFMGGQGGRGHFGPPGGGFMGGQFGYPSMGGQFGYPGMGKPTPPQFGGQMGAQMGAQMSQDKMYGAFMDRMGMGPPRMYNQGPGNIAGNYGQQGGIAQLFNPNGGGATQQGQSQMITGGQYPGMQGQPGGPPMNTLPYFPGTPPMQGQPGGPPMNRTQTPMMGQPMSQLMGQFGAL